MRSLLFFETGILLDLKLADLVRLAGQHAPGILLLLGAALVVCVISWVALHSCKGSQADP